MGNNMNSTIKLKYDELETLKSLINLYMQSDGKVIENNWHNNNASTNIFHNEVIEISNKITVSLTNQYREE